MTALTEIHRRPFIACLALTLALLGSSFGVAKAASAAAPERPTAIAAHVLHADVPTLRHHLAELEVESGDVRHPLETLNLATSRPLDLRRSAAGGSSCGGWR
jgi:hypothetical protein